jgi:hypothetical protein
VICICISRICLGIGNYTKKHFIPGDKPKSVTSFKTRSAHAPPHLCSCTLNCAAGDVLILQPFVQRPANQEVLRFPLLPGTGVGKDRSSHLSHQVETLPGMATVCSLTWMALKIITFWSVAPCSLVEVHWLFGGTHCLYLQGRRLSKACFLVRPTSFVLRSWRWRQCVPPKHLWALADCSLLLAWLTSRP